jgi:nicotinamide riboside kinase
LATLRICLTGPESTGKTWLATELATSYGTTFVPEYARQYAEEHPRPLELDDVESIALGEISLLDDEPDGLLAILDTDLLSTVVYSNHYYGTCPGWIVEEAKGRLADLYVLLDVDTPWADDAVRDAAQDRLALFEDFRSTLLRVGARFETVSGNWEQRSLRVRELVDSALR